MYRWILLGPLGVALLAIACGEVETGGTGGGGGGGTSSMSMSSSGPSSSTGPMCPMTASPGCCPGDGICCDCVSGHVCTANPFATPDEAALTFDACACKADVCGPTCAGACMGTGIPIGCQDCVTEASKGACATEFAACPSQM